MWYILGALIVLILLVGVVTYVKRKTSSETQDDTIIAPEAGCCGAHAVCEKGLKKVDSKIDYFEDEELDKFKGRTSDNYNDTEIDLFRDVLYTLKQNEIEMWLISLDKREVALPTILRQEAVEMINN